MKKPHVSSILLFVSLLISNINCLALPQSEQQKDTMIRALSARFNELYNKYLKKKADKAPPNELHQYKVKLDNISKYARRVALGLTAAALLAAGAYTGYKTGSGVAATWPGYLIPGLIFAEAYFTTKDKLKVINNILILYGKNPIKAPQLGIERYDQINPNKRDHIYYWLLSGALDQDLDKIKQVLQQGGIYDLDEPWMWQALATLYFRTKPTEKEIQTLQVSLEWPKWLQHWKNIEKMGQLFDIIPNNQSIKYMESGKFGNQFKRGITRLELSQIVDKKLKEYAEKQLLSD